MIRLRWSAVVSRRERSALVWVLAPCRLVLLAAVVAAASWLVPPAAIADVHKAVIDAPISPIQAEYVQRALDQAERERSEMFLLVLNTPGGLVDSMEQVISRMLVSRVPVCVFVYPPGGRAASAGFMILVSADVAAMAPGTRAGAAHPILSIGGVIPLGEPEERKSDEKDRDQTGSKPRPPAPGNQSVLLEKIRQDIQAYLRAIAERRGRNASAAELAVTESRSYSDQEALDERLIDLVASNETDLLVQLEGREIRMLDGEVRRLSTAAARVVEIPMTFREKVLQFLTNPNMAFLLAVVGALLLYVEITHAGMVLPGVVGGILLLLAVMGFSFLPINATGVLLIVAGLGLFVAEVLVQGFGLLGVAGAVCLALGAIMLVDLPDKELTVDPFLAVGLAVALGIISIFLMSIAVRALRRRTMTGMEGLRGLVGVAMTPLSPSGKVLLRGEYWNATSDPPAAKGAQVRCVGIEGLVLRVEPLSPGPGGPVEGQVER